MVVGLKRPAEPSEIPDHVHARQFSDFFQLAVVLLRLGTCGISGSIGME